MKNVLLVLTVIFFYSISYGQVGINTTDPKAQLDIRSSSQSSPEYTDGLLIPRINKFPATKPTSDQDSMLVYLVLADGTDAPGFYYWNHASTTWIGIPGPRVKKVDDLEDGKSDSAGSSIFIGVDAGASDNGTNNQNVGVGYQSLQTITNGIRNVGVGVGALQKTTGNYNTGIGHNALVGNESGLDNVAVGAFSLKSNIAGRYNVALGNNSLASNTASYNTAIGNRSLELNTTGKNNNAIGSSALGKNTTGSYNNAMGSGAMGNNTTGSLNVAYGNSALGRNTNGSGNAAFGARTLTENTTGIDNVGIGLAALFKSTTASRNVAIGSGTLGGANLTGGRNIGIGVGALSHNTSGENNIAIGDRSSRFTNNSNTVTLGNSSHNNYIMYGASWTNASDRSLKKEIKDIPVGLEFVNKLNPVEFVYLNAASNEDKTFGFIAQEIQQLVQESDIEGNAIVGEIGVDLLGLKQVEFIPILTKAIQEQQDQIENLEQQLKELNNKLDLLLGNK